MAEIFAIQVSKSYITLLLPTNSRMHPIDSGWRSLIVSFSNGAHNAEHLVGRKDLTGIAASVLHFSAQKVGASDYIHFSVRVRR